MSNLTERLLVSSIIFENAGPRYVGGEVVILRGEGGGGGHGG